MGLIVKFVFFETERCTEMFFLYYFIYTTKKFSSYDEVEKAIQHAVKSTKHKDEHGINYSFSELGDMFTELFESK